MNTSMNDSLRQKLAESIEVLRLARERYGEKLIYPTSLGAEAMVLVDIICRHVPGIAMLTLDSCRSRSTATCSGYRRADADGRANPRNKGRDHRHAAQQAQCIVHYL